MILVDTSVWVDHFRGGDEALAGRLDRGEVLIHPFVIGELALGHLPRRELILGVLHDLPRVIEASDSEVLQFIDRQRLFGIGIGYIDAHLLAAIRLTPGAALWTRDRSLRAVAAHLGLAADTSLQ